MKKLLLSLITTFIVISCQSQPSKKETAQNLKNDSIQKVIETYMNAQNEINDFSGVVLVTKGNQILFKKAYGFALVAS
jgi:hypothetical protein